jgi:small GTP-binding protein
VLQELRQLTTLDLGSNQLTDISVLQELRQLTTLDLGSNQLTDISVLQELRRLTTLDLGNNNLTDISVLQKLSQLTTLNLRNNNLTDISVLQGLRNMTELDLYNNKIKELPEWIVYMGMGIDVESDFSKNNTITLKYNPLENPPIEIIKQGKDAIREYFKSLKEGEKPLNEVKVLLVGDGAAGKTSLVKRILDKGFDPNEPQTHGINIDPWTIPHRSNGTHGDNEIKTIKVIFWDFGGQEIMHSTHQFFLSKRSAYVLVLDGRRDEKTEYWLKLIESFGGDSPVLVVMNKIDQNPGFKLNKRFLQDKYKNIIGFYRVSCKKNTGAPAFKKALQSALLQIEIIKTTWPADWFKVKEKLEKMSEHYISYSDYKGICVGAGVTEIIGQRTLIEFLNDLGVTLYFEDPELKHMQVLEPRWITGGVYEVINSKVLAENKGVLYLADLEGILEKEKGDIYHYPVGCHIFIIRLMEKFELCYPMEDARKRILIPDLLDEEEPVVDFSFDDSLKFIIEYDFLPRSVMPRFIVNMHRDIKEKLQWRTGVVLEDKEFKSTAVVKVDHEAKRVYIYVDGGQKRDYFAAILTTLRRINGSFEKLETTELVPMPDDSKITADYKQLIRHEQRGYEFYLPGGTEKEYKVKDLLGTITMDGPTIDDVFQILKKIVDATDTKETITQKVNSALIVQPNLFGIGIDVSKITDMLLSWAGKKGREKKGKKKK